MPTVQLRFLQKLKHPQHPIHRGADFVAHISQKLRFGAVGAVSHFLSGLQIAFVPIQRLRNALEGYGRQVGALRLVARGVSPLVGTPVAVTQRDVAAPEAKQRVRDFLEGKAGTKVKKA